jgi:hypothetical protein
VLAVRQSHLSSSRSRLSCAQAERRIRVRDGKIVEEHEVFDALGLMQQLGAVPES